MRVYLPATVPMLAAVLDSGVAAPAGARAYAVTPALREAYASGDDEELEYAAQGRAADASVRLLRADASAPRRRVVLALDVDDPGDARPDPAEAGAVVLGADVPLRRVASVLVDDVAAEADVALAVDDPEDLAALDDLADHELLWFAAQELRDLVDGSA